jgi:Tfp pilus assembly PilM family ATPase
MHTSTFFRLFPPPKFLTMKHAGLEISDEAIHCLEYTSAGKSLKIDKYSSLELPRGLIEGGDIRNEDELVKLLIDFNKKMKLSYVKMAIPEEKAYLFQTDVPSPENKIILQNIEFKLEENVPLTAPEAVFYFDLLPVSLTDGNLRASVSVVPKSYIDQYIGILKKAGIAVIAFEVVPKSIARATIPRLTDKTHMIVHMMRHKTGLYIVSDGVVCFTSTVSGSSQEEGHVDDEMYVASLGKEINRVYQYWLSHGGAAAAVGCILLAGRNASKYESNLQNVVREGNIPVQTAHVWENVFDVNAYVPPISKEESLEYAVSAGLAMPLLI